jgi:hypothetical protein
MPDNPLTANGWNAILNKNKTIKDNGLKRALADFEDVDEDDHAAQLAAIAKVNKLAANLQQNKDVADNEVVSNYLENVQDAADDEQKEITKAKVTADKAEALAEKQEKQEEAFENKLSATLQKLKSSQGVSYQFILCEGPDGCKVMVNQVIQTQHRQQIIQMSHGRKVLGPGSCRFEDGKYVFVLDHAPSGLAKKLQVALLESTGRRLPIVLGDEAEDGEA